MSQIDRLPDLNLLRLFVALMQERHVTRAGERLFLSQPAASGGLKRLREQFHDELLVREGQELRPTPRAEELYGTRRAPLPAPAAEISQELEGIGPVRSYFVDVSPATASQPPLPQPTLTGRIGRTLAVAGSGLPYMLGLRRSRRTAPR